MADLLCERCGEPWDFFYIQDEMTPEERKTFHAGRGCEACIGVPRERWAHRAEASRAARMAQGAMRDVLGSDIDGLAAEMQDLHFT